jgi:hypothetical protein
MVEPPRVEVLAHPSRHHHLGDLLGQLRQAGREVRDVVEARNAGEKVMDARLRIAVTAVALMYECAESTRTARGRGTDRPRTRHASVYRLRSRVFSGPQPGQRTRRADRQPGELSSRSSLS